jgi:2-phospho-L-lactate guanylyltransferase
MEVLAVPLKSPDLAKSRLRAILSPSEREALSLGMFEDVLDACLAQPGWHVWAISRDGVALDVASRKGALAVPELGESLLDAVRQVERAVRADSATLAVVLADLPLITGPALGRVLARSAAMPVVAVPAGSDAGTNVLIRRPPAVIPAKFGRASFSRHRLAAYRAGVTFDEARSVELGFDLDGPADLAKLLASGGGGRAWSVCLEMGLPDRLQVRI